MNPIPETPMAHEHGTNGRSHSSAQLLSQVRLVGPEREETEATVTEAAPGREGATERKRKPYPTMSFEEAIALAVGIWHFSGGEKARRITLFEEHLEKSSESGPSRHLITTSSKYGLTIGGYRASHLELTPEGRAASGPEADPLEQVKARFELAIHRIEPFRALYEFTKDKKMPQVAALRDVLKDRGFNDADASECIGLFVTNAKFVGVLRPSAGAERMFSIEHLIEERSRVLPRPEGQLPASSGGGVNSQSPTGRTPAFT